MPSCNSRARKMLPASSLDLIILTNVPRWHCLCNGVMAELEAGGRGVSKGCVNHIPNTTRGGSTVIVMLLLTTTPPRKEMWHVCKNNYGCQNHIIKETFRRGPPKTVEPGSPS